MNLPKEIEAVEYIVCISTEADDSPDECPGYTI